MRFTCAARTDTGLVRPVNEDRYLMLADRRIFIVADGMGGHAAGEVASEMAVRSISRAVGSLRGMSAEEASNRMRTALHAASAEILEHSRFDSEKRGMGTTATVLALLEGCYCIGHVGDSRAYLFRGGRLAQLTRDHSYVEELVEAGLLTRRQASMHPLRAVITRWLGGCEEIVPDIHVGTLEEHDTLLLASDGLTEMLDDELLARILGSDGEPRDQVDRMIAEANIRGGVDNLTAVVVRTDIVSSEPGTGRSLDGASVQLPGHSAGVCR
jgi:protein phosphatase